MAFVALFASLLFPLLGLGAAGFYYKYNDKRTILVALLVGLSMAAIAHGLDVNGHGDLSMYLSRIQMYHGVDLDGVFNVTYEGLYVLNLVMWLVERTGDYYLFQTLVAFVEYSVSAYIILSFSKKQGVSSSKALASLFVFLVVNPFFTSVSSSRSTMALFIILLAVYRDLVQDKKNILTLLLYAIPCFIHLAAIGLITVRLLLLLFRIAPRLSIAISLLAIPGILAFSSAAGTTFGGGILSTLINTISEYGNWTSGAWAETVRNSSYYVYLKYAIGSYIIVELISALRRFRLKSLNNEAERLSAYMLLTGALTLSFFVFLLPSYLRYFYPFLALNIAVGNVLFNKDASIIIRAIDGVLLMMIVALNAYYTAISVNQGSLINSTLFGFLAPLFAM